MGQTPKERHDVDHDVRGLCRRETIDCGIHSVHQTGMFLALGYPRCGRHCRDRAGPGVSVVSARRPLVFGFDNAATSFSMSLGLLVLAFVTSEPVLSSRNGLLTTALISIATMVFSASMVRFVLIAIPAVLAICFVLSARDR